MTTEETRRVGELSNDLYVLKSTRTYTDSHVNGSMVSREDLKDMSNSYVEAILLTIPLHVIFECIDNAILEKEEQIRNIVLE